MYYNEKEQRTDYLVIIASWRSYRIMAGDKAVQAQDQAHQVQGCRAVVDDYLDYRRCVRRSEILELVLKQWPKPHLILSWFHLSVVQMTRG